MNMIKQLRRVLMCVPVCAAALATPLPADQPTDFGQGTQIGRVDALPPLPRDLRKLYGQFRREARYFAAFAVNFDKGRGFYIQNFHDAGSVRTAALEGCRVLSKDDNCVIYAVAMPETVPVATSRATGFSELAADDFNTVYREYRTPGTYAAFAISGASHHGYGNAYAKEADARDTAISYCKVGVAKDMAHLGPEARALARSRGWQNCKVVDVSFTPAQ